MALPSASATPQECPLCCPPGPPSLPPLLLLQSYLHPCLPQCWPIPLPSLFYLSLPDSSCQCPRNQQWRISQRFPLLPAPCAATRLPWRLETSQTPRPSRSRCTAQGSSHSWHGHRQSPPYLPAHLLPTALAATPLPPPPSSCLRHCRLPPTSLARSSVPENSSASISASLPAVRAFVRRPKS